MLNYKLLVLEVLAVLAMNTAYADDSSSMELFNEKEASNIETTVEKLPSIPTIKPSNIKKSKLILSLPLQNPVTNNRSKSDKIKRRKKTHYGIGYEYRKSMQEQVQKTGSVVRSEKTQRPERVERPEKISRPERIERPERINRPERIDRPDRPGQH